jgi:hypothetical protein
MAESTGEMFIRFLGESIKETAKGAGIVIGTIGKGAGEIIGEIASGIGDATKR